MTVIFYLASLVAIVATFMVITRANPIHALLYLVVSLLAVALIFYVLGAPFVAALEVIIYAGAIIVLFIFVVMMLNLGPESTQAEYSLMQPHQWVGPSILSLILFFQVLYLIFATGGSEGGESRVIPPQEVGAAMFGPYVIGIELVSILLLAGLVGAFHLGRQETQPLEGDQ